MTTTINKEEHRKVFWDDWASKAEESGQHLRFMLGIDDINEATIISSSDIPEVIGLLPDLSGMDVLELASGVGRFTPELAKRAKHVVSTDFTESFVEENRRVNGPNFSNVTFRTLDATKLDYPENSFDCIFFAWLLAYLSDNEVRNCAETFLKLLRPGGFLFFRETLFTCACSCDTTSNAGEYRTVKEFRDLIKPARFSDQNGDIYYLEHIFSSNSKTYTKYRKLPTLVNYLWKKSLTTERPDIQLETDKNLYNEECMQVYDRVIGDGFTMPGGLEATMEYDADVTSVDLSMLACEATLLRLAQLRMEKGSVKIADLSKTTFTPDSFDIILMKETLEFMNSFDNLFVKFYEWLNPNGQLLIGGCFRTSLSTEVPAGLKEEGLTLITGDQLIEELVKSGFSQVACKDLSDDFIGFIESDIKKLTNEKGLSNEIRMKFSQTWSAVAAALRSKDIQWLTVSAVKFA